MNRKLLSIFVLLIAFQLVGICQVSQIRITGRVTDQETGIALPGANIILKGSYTGTLTNIQGDFSILVPSEGSVLAFSFIGYIPQEIEIGDNTVIDVALITTTEALEEVVITAQVRHQIRAGNQQINTNS